MKIAKALPVPEGSYAGNAVMAEGAGMPEIVGK